MENIQTVTAEEAARLAQIAKQLDEQGEVQVQTEAAAGVETEQNATVH